MMRYVRALALGAALLASLPVTAAPVKSRATELARWQAQEARLFAVGWRLVTGNAAFCRNSAPALGLLLHDADGYAAPQAVRAALGLAGPIGVQAVASGSPAQAAGLRQNDTLLRVEGRELGAFAFDREAGWRRLADVNDAIEAGLRRNGHITLSWHGASGVTRETQVAGTPACPSRFELLGTGDRVVADGTRVLLGREFAGFAYPDALLAAAVAHELAHNLLGHRARLDREGRGQANIRATEREADRMMPWLLANAGYPPDAAARFMRRWGPTSTGGQLGGLLRARSHDGWDERAKLIEAELAAVAEAVAQGGRADWRARFPAAAP